MGIVTLTAILKRSLSRFRQVQVMRLTVQVPPPHVLGSIVFGKAHEVNFLGTDGEVAKGRPSMFFLTGSIPETSKSSYLPSLLVAIGHIFPPTLEVCYDAQCSCTYQESHSSSPSVDGFVFDSQIKCKEGQDEEIEDGKWINFTHLKIQG